MIFDELFPVLTEKEGKLNSPVIYHQFLLSRRPYLVSSLIDKLY